MRGWSACSPSQRAAVRWRGGCVGSHTPGMWGARGRCVCCAAPQRRARAQRRAPRAAWQPTNTRLAHSLRPGVFVRVDENNTFMWRALIIGPEGTPYCGGCFIFDIYFPGSYPQVGGVGGCRHTRLCRLLLHLSLPLLLCVVAVADFCFHPSLAGAAAGPDQDDRRRARPVRARVAAAVAWVAVFCTPCLRWCGIGLFLFSPPPPASPASTPTCTRAARCASRCWAPGAARRASRGAPTCRPRSRHVLGHLRGARACGVARLGLHRFTSLLAARS